ncbi:DUF6481 family protein [Sphingobium yanoikuyae]|jgi:predicted metal-dependent hydrolase|uniref:DUF6481 family protein n=1 Tax=Sphingobium yanoikuyae TaxID=13690 RepID=UPI0004E31823|nr:DUF6481 family protein [Sphingobium yanoikuyae]KFD30137.1 hypothetical protein IH86_01930 [Sphingobium yanoikuyae]MDV3477814.1 DUF6481 family protein [Sphingobium yanoikuyae]
MKRYKEPGFQERIGAAARARTGALDQLRAKPPIDEAAAAARLASRLAKEAAKREKRQHALVAAKALEHAKAQEAAAAAAARQKPVLTEAERKAARDARYLARKNRSSS